MSLILVIVAAIAVILGVFGEVLGLVYVAIGTSLAALAVLGVGVVRRRRAPSSRSTRP